MRRAQRDRVAPVAADVRALSGSHVPFDGLALQRDDALRGRRDDAAADTTRPLARRVTDVIPVRAALRIVTGAEKNGGRPSTTTSARVVVATAGSVNAYCPCCR